MRKLAVAFVFLLVFFSLGISDVPELSGSEFIFARVKFNMDMRSMFDYREAPWHHDYPESEDLYLTMLKEVTSVRTTPESYIIVELDSPDIFKYPFLYFSEPGYMQLTPKETENLREYFMRGGFVMFDDFRGRDFLNLQYQLKKVFPDREMIRLNVTDTIFKSFYEIDSLEMIPPYFNPNSGIPEFWGMKDDKDRLILVANRDNDFGEFWEWVNKGEMPFQPAAQSVRFGINYLIYAMMH
jgi:hypothetical protein